MPKTSLVGKTIDVLRAIAAADGIGLSQLSRATGIPKATCLRIANELEEQRIAMFEPVAKRYVIGFGALTLVGNLVRPDSPVVLLQQILADLVSRTDETAGLDVLVDQNVIVVSQVQGPHVIGYAPKPVPRTLNTWDTSTGKVLLAGLSDDTIHRDHRRALTAARAARPDHAGLLAEIDQARTNGYAIARDEMEPGVAAVAAPVVVGSEVVAAVWIGGPTYRITPDRIDQLADDVRRSSVAIADVVTLHHGTILGATPRREASIDPFAQIGIR